MKISIYLIIILCLLPIVPAWSQNIELIEKNLAAVDVSMSREILNGAKSLKVVKNSAVNGSDQPTFVKIKGINFRNGTIQAKLMSTIANDAPVWARGFIGIAFRINDDNSKFECIYLRPRNARDKDPARRNHSIQYFSYPDFPFVVSRKESPGKYEAWADMAMDEWIDVKIVVQDTQAKLFINGGEKPCLIVNDLKHGSGLSGSVGLWVDSGTEGYFSELVISK